MSIVLITILVFMMVFAGVLTDLDRVWADTLVAGIPVGEHPVILESDPGNGNVELSIRDTVLMSHTIASWGCVPEITENCIDMTNTSSTYLSLAVGAIVGALISWLVYALQKKSTTKQEENLQRLKELNESHDKILKLIEQFQKHQERVLEQILSMDKKIDSAIEKKK